MGRNPVFMLNSFLFSVFIGAALGFLAGLGVGGGSLLILWLTAVLEMDPRTARSINLMFFLPAAGICSLFLIGQGTLNIRKILPAMAAGCLCAAAASRIAVGMDLHLLKKLFGVLLLFTGLREILYKRKREP